MFPLTDKEEKEEKIDPKGIHKVPENSGQAQAQVIFNRVTMSDVLIQYADQGDYPGKDVKQVSPCDHVQKRRGHIALRARRVQSRLDQLVEAIELVEDKRQAQNQGESQKQIGSRVISCKQ